MNDSQLQLADYIPQIKPIIKFRSKYLQWKYDSNYRESDNKEKCCKNCQNHVEMANYGSTKFFHKCNLLGISNSSATDIRAGHICDYYWEYKGVILNESSTNNLGR